MAQQTLTPAELIAKKVLTAKTHKTAAEWGNKINTLSEAERKVCISLQQTHGNPAMIGYGAIYPNSYLVGGSFRG